MQGGGFEEFVTEILAGRGKEFSVGIGNMKKGTGGMYLYILAASRKHTVTDKNETLACQIGKEWRL